MVDENSHKLTLDRPAIYQIKVPGVLKEKWINIDGEISVLFEKDNDGTPITTLTVTVDQAALHGLLRRLYFLGLPLISVIHIDERRFV